MQVYPSAIVRTRGCQMNRSRLPHRLAAGCALLAVIAVALTVALGCKIADAISRFHAQITPEAVGQWVKEAMLLSLEQGTPEQKLAIVFDLSEFTRKLFIHGLRERNPHLDEEQFHKLFLARLEKCHNRNY